MIQTATNHLKEADARVTEASRTLYTCMENARDKLDSKEYSECVGLLEQAKASLFGVGADVREGLQAEIDFMYWKAEIGVRFAALERQADAVEAEVKALVAGGMFNMAREVKNICVFVLCVCVCVCLLCCFGAWNPASARVYVCLCMCMSRATAETITCRHMLWHNFENKIHTWHLTHAYAQTNQQKASEALRIRRDALQVAAEWSNRTQATQAQSTEPHAELKSQPPGSDDAPHESNGDSNLRSSFNSVERNPSAISSQVEGQAAGGDEDGKHEEDDSGGNSREKSTDEQYEDEFDDLSNAGSDS